MNSEVTKGYKVTSPDMTCMGYQYELGKLYSHSGNVELCEEGFHFCNLPQNCFNYYDFDPSNRVFEIEATGTVIHGDYKSVSSEIKFVREIPWAEVLTIVNTGKDNTGHSNSGNRNSGDRNSGDRNSGDWNSGYRNSGDSNSGDSNSGNRNSGNRNSGNRNSGNRNSGDWNSGNRNSGDSNSGYRNSGAFCTERDPEALIFDKPSGMTVRQWENHEACQIMYNIEPNIWVPEGMMSDEEKAANPKYETTGGYLKSIPMHEAWSNLWHNLTDQKRKVFTSLPNFDSNKFKEITGITV